MKIFTTIAFIILISSYGYSQKFFQYTITSDTGEEINVEDALRDKNGYIWMATQRGLLRYDGRNLTTFRKNIPSQHGYRLISSGSGFYYAHNAGVSYIIPSQIDIDAGLIVEANIAPQSDQIHYPHDMVLQGNDNLWISQEKGFISLFNQGRLTHFQPTKELIRYQLVIHKEILYAMAENGRLYFYDQGSSTFRSIGEYPGCNKLIATADGLVLYGNQLIYLDSIKGNLKVKSRIDPEPEGKILSLALYNESQLLLSIENKGLFLLEDMHSYDTTLKKLYSNNDPHRVDELPFNLMKRIVVDEVDHSIFLCLDNGLGVLKKRFFESVNDLHNGHTTSITGNDKNEVYVNMGEVYKVTSTSSGYNAQLIDLPITESVGSVHYFNDLLYCGTGEGKIYTLNDRLTLLIDMTDRGEGIFFMHGDKKSRLWLCQAPDENPIVGIACILPGGRLKEYGLNEGLNNRILVVKESKRGRIYVAGIGESSYLYRFIEDEDRYENMSLPMDFDYGNNFEVHDMAIADDGTIYLASTAGLLRHDLDRVVKIDLGDAYKDIEIRSVHAAADGKVWLSTETQGMLYLDDSIVISVSEESGLPSKVMSYRGIYSDKHNRLWIGTAEGAVYTLTEGPTLASTRSPFIVSSNYRNRDTCLVGVVGNDLILNMRTIASSDETTWYKYAIGEEDWSSPISGNEIVISELNKGIHTLKIKSRINGGYEWSAPYSITLNVKPIWYKNPLIYIPLLFIGVGSFIFYFLRLKSASINKDNDHSSDILLEPKIYPEESHQMAILSSIISRLNHGMKWDFILEELSTSLFRIDHVDAFFICWKENNDVIIYEGANRNNRIYGKLKKNAISDHIAQCLNNGKVIFEEELNKYKTAEASLFSEFHSIAGVPFRLRLKEKAAIVLLSNGKLDKGHLNFLHPLSSYLEQIT